MTYTITPRPQHRDVLLQRDGGETIIVRHEGLGMDALEDKARQNAAMVDGRAEAVIAADEQYRHVASALQDACTMGAISLARYRSTMRSLCALHGDDGPAEGEP